MPETSIEKDSCTSLQTWNGWVSKQSLLKAAKCVGVTATGLSVNFMQTEKFEQAAGILEGNNTNEVPETPHAYVSSPQNIRKNSALYWKSKFMSAQDLVEESNEKNVQLDQIPGLLTINKITPKRTETNVRVVQVCGSMQGKDMLQVVKSTSEEKSRNVEGKKAKKNQKLNDPAAFHKCKETCVSHKSKCEASGLKECSSCHNVLRSICGKVGGRKNGKRPMMIYPSVGRKINVRQSVNKENDSEDSKSFDSKYVKYYCRPFRSNIKGWNTVFTFLL